MDAERDRRPLLRLLFSRESLVGLLVVTIGAVTCIFLGLWQFGRFEDKRDRAALIEQQVEAEPQSLATVLPEHDSTLAPDAEWSPVRMHGRYCTGENCVLYVRNRTLGGRTGFWQLVPFTEESGRTTLVVRGWVDSDSQRSAPAEQPRVPDGELTVTGVLRPVERELSSRSDPPGQVQSVHPGTVAERTGVDPQVLTAGAYLVMREEDPAHNTQALLPLPRPDTSLGPHLSYAFQWWIFASFFPVGWVVLLRRRLREEDDATDSAPDPPAVDTDEAHPPSTPTPDGAPPSRRRSRRPTRDEEEEDALIDQQFF